MTVQAKVATLEQRKGWLRKSPKQRRNRRSAGPGWKVRQIANRRRCGDAAQNSAASAMSRSASATPQRKTSESRQSPPFRPACPVSAGGIGESGPAGRWHSLALPHAVRREWMASTRRRLPPSRPNGPPRAGSNAGACNRFGAVANCDPGPVAPGSRQQSGSM